MLIEQIVERQLRGPEPSGLTCTSITGYFHDKTKISRDNAPYFPLPGPNHVQLNFNTKIQDVKRVLDLNCY